MLEIGVMLNNLEPDRVAAFAVAVRHGFRVVHTSALPESMVLGGEWRAAYLDAARSSGLEIATMFVGYDGQSYADVPAIEQTVGLAVASLRPHRLMVTLAYTALARLLGSRSLSTHLGFFPDDLQHPEYIEMVGAVRQIADHAAAESLSFNLETGQEPAAALVRFLRELDRPSVGVNFDAANFVLYGSDDPVRAVELLGPYIRGVHCKDGIPPTDSGALGKEVPLGSGQVDWPLLLRRLREFGYSGPLVIERERGPNVVADILAARTYLEQLQ